MFGYDSLNQSQSKRTSMHHFLFTWIRIRKQNIDEEKGLLNKNQQLFNSDLPFVEPVPVPQKKHKKSRSKQWKKKKSRKKKRNAIEHHTDEENDVPSSEEYNQSGSQVDDDDDTASQDESTTDVSSSHEQSQKELKQFVSGSQPKPDYFGNWYKSH